MWRLYSSLWKWLLHESCSEEALSCWNNTFINESSKFKVLKHGQWYNITLQSKTKAHIWCMYMFEKWCNPELVTVKYCMAALKSMSNSVNTSSYQPAMHGGFVNNKPWITSDMKALFKGSFRFGNMNTWGRWNFGNPRIPTGGHQTQAEQHTRCWEWNEESPLI